MYMYAGVLLHITTLKAGAGKCHDNSKRARLLREGKITHVHVYISLHTLATLKAGADPVSFES